MFTMEYKVYQQKRLELTKIKEEGLRTAVASALEYVFFRDLEKIRPNPELSLTEKYTTEQIALIKRDSKMYMEDSRETKDIMDNHARIFEPYNQSSEVKEILNYQATNKNEN
jgi:hypothetical protein